MKTIYSILLFFLIASCDNQDNKRESIFNYSYEIASYIGDPNDNNNYQSSEFYDSNNRLIRILQKEEGCTSFLYDKKGKLIEKRWGRNCTNGVRELMIYDEHDNLIGSYYTRDTLINLDTVKFFQTKYYDKQNRLVKEKIDGFYQDMWKHYTYRGKQIISDLILSEGYTVWKSTYKYDSNNNLIKITRVRGELNEIETFQYDEKNRLVKKTISSTEYPITPEICFSAINNSTTFQYNNDGLLVKEILFNHLGKPELVTINVKKTPLKK